MRISALVEKGIVSIAVVLLSCSFSVQERLRTIPLNDLRDITVLFRTLYFRNGFAYTCFGDKAISYHCFNLNEKADRLDHVSPIPLNIWKKYAHLFPMHDFVFLFSDNEEEHLSEVTLINKQAFKKIFDEYRQEFITLFDSQIDDEALLNFLIEKGSLWNTPLKNREDLIGILLGFGKINAQLYQRKVEILGNKKSVSRLQKIRLSPSKEYQTLDEELSYLKAHLKIASDENLLLHAISLPSFAADREQAETQRLLKKYREQRSDFSKKYAKGDLLEITLEQLCYGN